MTYEQSTECNCWSIPPHIPQEEFVLDKDEAILTNLSRHRNIPCAWMISPISLSLLFAITQSVTSALWVSIPVVCVMIHCETLVISCNTGTNASHGKALRQRVLALVKAGVQSNTPWKRNAWNNSSVSSISLYFAATHMVAVPTHACQLCFRLLDTSCYKQALGSTKPQRQTRKTVSFFFSLFIYSLVMTNCC